MKMDKLISAKSEWDSHKRSHAGWKEGPTSIMPNFGIEYAQIRKKKIGTTVNWYKIAFPAQTLPKTHFLAYVFVQIPVAFPCFCLWFFFLIIINKRNPSSILPLQVCFHPHWRIKVAVEASRDCESRNINFSSTKEEIQERTLPLEMWSVDFVWG